MLRSTQSAPASAAGQKAIAAYASRRRRGGPGARQNGHTTAAPTTAAPAYRTIIAATAASPTPTPTPTPRGHQPATSGIGTPARQGDHSEHGDKR